MSMKNGDEMVKNKTDFKNKKIVITMLLLLFAFCFLICGCGEQTTQSVEVDGILISKKNLYMAEGQTAVISAQVYPFNASNQNYSFESNNPDVVSIDDGFVVAKKAGDAIIYVVSDEGGYEDSCNVLVTTAKNNLEINDFNNLNMPADEIEPIYNSYDYEENSKAKTLASQQSKRINNKNAINNIKQNVSKNQNNNRKLQKNSQIYAKNDKKTDNFLDYSKNIAKQVNAEITNDVEIGKQVIDDFKTEIMQSIENISHQKEVLNSFWSDAQSSMFGAFNNLEKEILNSMQNFQNELLNEIEEAEQKVETGEYTIESKDLNGVSFVVIKNAE